MERFLGTKLAKEKMREKAYDKFLFLLFVRVLSETTDFL